MKHALAVLLLSLPALCLAQGRPNPPCDRWPTNIAEGRLKSAGILGSIDYTKTEAVQLASEKIGKYEDGEQMWREVYHITFHEKNGNKVKVIAVNEGAGEFECSIGGVDVFIVSGHLPSRDTDRVFKQIE